MKSILNRILSSLEAIALYPDYPLRSWLTHRERALLIAKLFVDRWQFWRKPVPEIRALICTPADERVLVPVLFGLLRHSPKLQGSLKVSAVIPCTLNPNLKRQLKEAGCHVENNLADILTPCAAPQNKLALFCLDQRFFYPAHARGVHSAEILKQFGVKTASIQHGGTRQDSVQGLASATSERILVWGERVYRELTAQYEVPPHRLRLVGNHLHDRIHQIDCDQALLELKQFFPQFWAEARTKKVILLATCLHTEYADRANEAELYQAYMQYLYDNLDFTQVCLIIKMHPSDSTDPNLYRAYLPEQLQHPNAICIVEPQHPNLDIYTLLHLSNLLITRASTVAEEALLLNKKVIAVDVDQFGPSGAYRHLEEYSNYKTVYLSAQVGLKQAVQQALFEGNKADQTVHDHLEREFTYALDGNSLQRTVAELLQQLHS